MRRVGYILGIALLIAGAALGMVELLAYVQGEPSRVSLGSIWAGIDANSLVGFQSLIENRVSPALWPPIQWLLVVPVGLVLTPLLILLGILVVLWCRPRFRA